MGVMAERALRSIQLLHSEASAETDRFRSFFQTIQGRANDRYSASREGIASAIDFKALDGLFGLPRFR
jgi:hypothetical protein